MTEKDNLYKKSVDLKQFTLAQDWGKFKVLVVEDDLSYEYIWSQIIERAEKDAQFFWATSEPEAEQMIYAATESGHSFDLIITDIFLSGSKTGIDLWTQFQNAFPGRIIISSAVDYKRFSQYFAPNHVGPVFIQKPLIIDECIETICSVLHKINI